MANVSVHWESRSGSYQMPGVPAAGDEVLIEGKLFEVAQRVWDIDIGTTQTGVSITLIPARVGKEIP